MKVFVVNLDRDTERLAHMQALLGGMGIAYERIAAVDGRMLTAEVRAAASPELSPGEIGCLMSHRAAWERIAAGSERYALILEDDIHASRIMGAFAQSDAWIPPDADVVTLEAGRRPVALARATASEHERRRVRRMLSTHSGAAAYIVSRQAAAVLLKRSEAPLDTADAIAFDPPPPGSPQLTLYQVEPALCVQDAFLPRALQTASLASNLQTDRQRFRRRNASLAQRIVRELKYPLSKLARAMASAFGGEQWVAVPFVE
jgi:glycosyl transferase family 25